MYDFQAEASNELTTYAGETLTVIDPVCFFCFCFCFVLSYSVILAMSIDLVPSTVTLKLP
jgi:hypothetical protein